MRQNPHDRLIATMGDRKRITACDLAKETGETLMEAMVLGLSLYDKGKADVNLLWFKDDLFVKSTPIIDGFSSEKSADGFLFDFEIVLNGEDGEQ